MLNSSKLFFLSELKMFIQLFIFSTIYLFIFLLCRYYRARTGFSCYALELSSSIGVISSPVAMRWCSTKNLLVVALVTSRLAWLPVVWMTPTCWQVSANYKPNGTKTLRSVLQTINGAHSPWKWKVVIWRWIQHIWKGTTFALMANFQLVL